MNEDEALGMLGRICGLGLGLALGLFMTLAPADLAHVSTSICLATAAESGRDARTDCAQAPVLTADAAAPVQWVAPIALGD